MIINIKLYYLLHWRSCLFPLFYVLYVVMCHVRTRSRKEPSFAIVTGLSVSIQPPLWCARSTKSFPRLRLYYSKSNGDRTAEEMERKGCQISLHSISDSNKRKCIMKKFRAIFCRLATTLQRFIRNVANLHMCIMLPFPPLSSSSSSILFPPPPASRNQWCAIIG